MKSDAELLRAYAEAESEPDFAAFVNRHLSFVYNAALRRAGGDPHRAAEIVQYVFIDAARRARALARHPSVVGWLHVATRHAAINLARSEARQRVRETVAYHMNQPDANERERLAWEELQPVIDRALDALDERDRQAILARFFEHLDYRAIGERLWISENAARMRVDRALDKLRATLRRHGIGSTAAALAGGLAQQSVVAVPNSLAPSVCAAAVASGPAWGAATATLLSMSKFKTSLVAAVALAAILSPPLVQVHANRALRAEIAAGAAATARANDEHAQVAATLAAAVGDDAAAETAELARLRARAATLRARPPGVVESELKPPANRGWDSPDAAFETIQWAFRQGDWKTMGQGMSFDAKTKAQIDAFYATLAPAVRAQYPTSELFFAHAWYEAMLPNASFIPQTMDVVSTQLIDGPEPMQLRLWGRDANGTERGTLVRMERGPNGWALGASHIAEVVTKLIPNIDSATGAVKPEALKQPEPPKKP